VQFILSQAVNPSVCPSQSDIVLKRLNLILRILSPRDR